MAVSLMRCIKISQMDAKGVLRYKMTILPMVALIKFYINPLSAQGKDAGERLQDPYYIYFAKREELEKH